ncbi:MAG: hypothetical protein CMM01_18015 [Rhodopirellula sp.]|nr:hypothetical protein [Rhodopirellula sp.]
MLLSKGKFACLVVPKNGSAGGRAVAVSRENRLEGFGKEMQVPLTDVANRDCLSGGTAITWL